MQGNEHGFLHVVGLIVGGVGIVDWMESLSVGKKAVVSVLTLLSFGFGAGVVIGQIPLPGEVLHRVEQLEQRLDRVDAVESKLDRLICDLNKIPAGRCANWIEANYNSEGER